MLFGEVKLMLRMCVCCSAQGTGIKTISAMNRMMSSESVSNISDPDSQKKMKRELRLGDRVLVRSSVFEPHQL